MNHKWWTSHLGWGEPAAQTVSYRPWQKGRARLSECGSRPPPSPFCRVLCFYWNNVWICYCSVSHAWFFVTPWTSACQASLSTTNSQSLLKLMSIESVMASNHLSSPSPPAFNVSQYQDLFKWVSSSHQVDKLLEFQLQHQSFQWIFRTDFL